MGIDLSLRRESESLTSNISFWHGASGIQHRGSNVSQINRWGGHFECVNTMGLDAVEFIISIEKHYSITLPDEDMETLGVVGDFVVYVANAYEMQNGNEVEFEEVYETIKCFLNRDFDISCNEINLKSRFVDDLGMG